MGFPGGASGKEPACQWRRCKRCRFDPWVGKIPWRRAQQPTPVFLPGESHAQRHLAGCSAQGCTDSDTAEVTWHTHSSIDKKIPELYQHILQILGYHKWRCCWNIKSLSILITNLKNYTCTTYSFKRKLITITFSLILCMNFIVWVN